MIKEIEKYVDGCNAYQRNKNHTEAPAEKLIPKIQFLKNHRNILVPTLSLNFH